jgi:hypothetical protein
LLSKRTSTYLPARIALADLKAAHESEHIGQPIRMCFSARSESGRVEGIDRRQNGAGIVHILKFYGFYEVVSVIAWLGASFAKSCGHPNILLYTT